MLGLGNRLGLRGRHSDESVQLGGGAPSLEAPLAGSLLWLRADTGLTVTGAGASTWLDQSGNDNHATMTTDVDRPAYEATGGPNSTACLTFDKSNTEHMELVGLTHASHDYTVFAVINQTTTAVDQIVLRSSANTVVSASTDTAKVGGHDGTAWRSVIGSKTGEQILCWRFNSSAGTVEVYRDGTLLGTGTYDGTWAWSDPRLGCGALSPRSWNLNAKLAEIMVFPTSLSDGNVATVHASLMTRYAITFSLASSIAGNVLWLDAELGTTVTGAGLSAWLDQGPSGNHAAQATDADRPALSAGTGPNGLAEVVFDSSNTEDMDLPSLSVSEDYTAFAVLDINNAIGTDTAILGGNSISLNPTRSSEVGTVDSQSNVCGGAVQGDQLLTWRIDGGTLLQCYRNGGLTGSDAVIDNNTFSGGSVTIGSYQSSMMWLAAGVSQFIVYDHLKTDEELALVHASLMTKFALTLGSDLATFGTSDTTQSTTIRVTADKAYYVDWGDGTVEAFAGDGSNQGVTHNYTASMPQTQTWSVADPTTIERFQCGSNGLTGSIPSLTAYTALEYFYCDDNLLSGSVPSLTANVALEFLSLHTNALTGYTASTISATLANFSIINNNLTQGAVDQILADFETGVAGRPASGTIALGGTGNSAPSAAGLASKANILIAKPGWTISHN